jgi:hypothetical protein
MSLGATVVAEAALGGVDPLGAISPGEEFIGEEGD